MFKKIRRFINRGTKGFNDEDLWNFDMYLCNIIPPALRSYIKTNHGCPGELYDNEAINDECHKWNVILEEIAQGFEAAKEISQTGCHVTKRTEDGLFTWEYDEDKAKLLTKKFERGMDLFKQYFFSLWD